MKTRIVLLMSIFILSTGIIPATGQQHPDFSIVEQVETTSVKDQQRTGTCWSFATVSFLETEVLREQGKSLDLSDMFPVYYAYQQKAWDYVRYHGTNNFSQGGQAHDVMHVLRKQGIVPQEAYSGKQYDFDQHNHSEMAAMLKGMLKPLKSTDHTLTQIWDEAVVSVLDTYMGAAPEAFPYKGETYTPKSFAEEVVALNPDDYVELSSYTHHPFYEPFDLEVPDNWSHDHYYNVPADELMQIMEHAIKNGYSVDWDGDVSEDRFSHGEGNAFLDDADKEGLKKHGLQTYRQRTFNNRKTTDDHLMHLTGIAENEDGERFFQTKNSWNVGSNDYDGYLYMAEDYVALKTIAIMVHKDAIPDAIAEKLFD